MILSSYYGNTLSFALIHFLKISLVLLIMWDSLTSQKIGQWTKFLLSRDLWAAENGRHHFRVP